MSKPETETRTTASANANANPGTAAPKAEPKSDAKGDKYNPFAPFFDLGKAFQAPFPMPFGFGPEAFAPWLREHASRLEAITDEIAAFETAMIHRMKTNAADVAALVQDSLDYLQQIGGEWRKIAIDTARRAADFTGKA